jgi:hypothetical protein
MLRVAAVPHELQRLSLVFIRWLKGFDSLDYLEPTHAAFAFSVTDGRPLPLQAFSRFHQGLALVEDKVSPDRQNLNDNGQVESN